MTLTHFSMSCHTDVLHHLTRCMCTVTTEGEHDYKRVRGVIIGKEIVAHYKYNFLSFHQLLEHESINPATDTANRHSLN